MGEGDLRDLTTRFPHAGRIEAILLRPRRRGELVAVESVRAIAACGLEGGHYAQPSRNRVAGGKRQVTLIQAEHLPVVAALSGKAFYSAIDAGFIAQNVYLYCASAGLGVVVRGLVDREALGLGKHRRVILAQSVGYPAGSSK